MWDWFRLRSGSPAAGTGPNGRDQGVPLQPFTSSSLQPFSVSSVAPVLGASIAGEPQGRTSRSTATLTVGVAATGNSIPVASWPNGSGYTHYKWRLDSGVWSAETPITTPIQLSGLGQGMHQVEVVGKRDANMYQNDPDYGGDAVVTLSRTWIVDDSTPSIRSE